MKQIALLALILTAAAQADTIVSLQSIPTSVNTGDTFDLGVYITPGPSDEVNTFSMDLLYSDFLTVDLTTYPIEDGYFAQNGVFFYPGNSGPGGTGLTGLFGISDVLAGGDYDPGPDELFDIVFTATAPGTAVVELGPNSFLQAPDGSNINIDANSVSEPPQSSTVPEPSAALLCGSALGTLAAMALRSRRT
jgi:hypothetical protein